MYRVIKEMTIFQVLATILLVGSGLSFDAVVRNTALHVLMFCTYITGCDVTKLMKQLKLLYTPSVYVRGPG
jgi:hypothetical protein